MLLRLECLETRNQPSVGFEVGALLATPPQIAQYAELLPPVFVEALNPDISTSQDCAIMPPPSINWTLITPPVMPIPGQCINGIIISLGIGDNSTPTIISPIIK